MELLVVIAIIGILAALPGTVSLPNAMWCNPGNTNGTPDSE